MPWDFALILAVLAIAVPILGARRVGALLARPDTTKADRLSLYLSTIAFQWIGTGLILWRAKVRGLSLAALGLAIPNVPLALTSALVLSAVLVAHQLIALRFLAGHPEAHSGKMRQVALRIFPRDRFERAVFVLVAITASVCEELIYRGFAQRVFQDSARAHVVAGIICSSILFAIGHVYQGRSGTTATFVVALLFSFSRSLTGSLVVPVTAHLATDLTAGFAGFGKKFGPDVAG
jgi:uncharacterized protein